jgi:hypothetical protein
VAVKVDKLDRGLVYQVGDTESAARLNRYVKTNTAGAWGSSGFCVGFTRESCSNAKLLGLMPVLDHEMVQQNSPGL